MKSIYRIKIIIPLFLIFISQITATDLKFSAVVNFDYWENEREDSVEMVIENDNVLTAVGYSVSF
jgi:hypothetical protein